jgi:Integron Cassette Protein Hfx_Cass5
MNVPIAEIAIAPTGELLVRPAADPASTFKYIWRAALCVNWDEARRCFITPPPREWSYAQWFGQILAAADSELGVILVLTPETTWQDVSEAQRRAMHEAAREVAVIRRQPPS